FTCSIKPGEVLKIPVAHGEGNFFIEDHSLESLISGSQIVFRYCNENGEYAPSSNPNGSVHNIAGICNPSGNVIGMMPHPERSCEDIIGGTDGRLIFESVFSWIESR
ncbi:MAG: phosphoribosylformylglycinamidine synthase subunit PurQ, partial [Thermodesulfobacteriota bacterium]